MVDRVPAPLVACASENTDTKPPNLCLCPGSGFVPVISGYGGRYQPLCRPVGPGHSLLQSGGREGEAASERESGEEVIAAVLSANVTAIYRLHRADGASRADGAFSAVCIQGSLLSEPALGSFLQGSCMNRPTAGLWLVFV
eukprot:1238309-Rhodomonas_salina.3